MILSFIAAIAAATSSAAADPPRYRIIVIEPWELEDNVLAVDARMRINNLGEVVGTVITDGLPTFVLPFVWLPTSNYNLNPGTTDLPIDPAYEELGMRAADINYNGIVVGSAHAGGPSTDGYVWDLEIDQHRPLVLLGGPKNEALAVNDEDPPTETLTFAEYLTEVGLTQGDWDEFLDEMEHGTESRKKNYNCWMQRYLSKCDPCNPCPGPDPFTN